ncbi:hypothetical protein [Deinococcus cellulosilyticus]|uniref:Uncharacterized protein n=1 Tax=Deinococcus cellulosilyticus (strain DSM 18568 / NBRC 106333 / KACC 11606 / 5516J-15) TaxID=1223518 RepID=A0A511N9Z1_DEIC1|nr:hypothetical protein [Deinococcus cellulosilyticus]GEM49643.1 hypothetical protein DC3_52780 [Deinococcus cellulosilyticus NBRC 106333 = KACC 11606]
MDTPNFYQPHIYTDLLIQAARHHLERQEWPEAQLAMLTAESLVREFDLQPLAAAVAEVARQIPAGTEPTDEYAFAEPSQDTPRVLRCCCSAPYNCLCITPLDLGIYPEEVTHG